MLLAVLSVFATAALAPLVYRLAGKATGWVLAVVPGALFAYFVRQLPHVAETGPVREVTPWIPSQGLEAAFYLDGLSLLFALMVTGIGTLIVVYAGGYLAHNESLGRFYVQLFLFMGAMLGLVVADNLYLFFVFFELTSLSSYLLIGFYHSEEDARVAARKALVVTGGGGLALLVGLVLLQQITGATTFSAMLRAGDLVTGHAFYTATFVLVALGAFTKSAQFPFHFWLPAAMAGPTPVSAYLHSATMVKAGVFVLARLSPVLGGTALWTTTLVLVGGFTMVLTAVLALRFTDLKQILAYTTTMALGALVMLLGIGTADAVKAMVVFTLVHALYKGALFMLAGNVDHETGTRDLAQLGGLREAMPITTAAGVLAGASMAGLPPMIGFIGKEAIYEAALHLGGTMGGAILGAALVANVALVAAGLLVGVRPFVGAQRGAFTRHPHEAPASMWLGPVLLGALGLVVGLVPWTVDHTLLQAATASIRQAPTELHLALWHGLNPALVASLVTFALGFGVYFAWETRVQPSAALRGLATALAHGPGRAFERGLYALARGSHTVTVALQNGKFRHYLMYLFVTTIVLVGTAYALKAQVTDWPVVRGNFTYYEVALAALLVLSALAAVRARDRFVAILALSLGGYAIALLYLLFGAPDLALTQFSVETLSLILLVIVLIHLPAVGEKDPAYARIRDGLLASGVGTVLVLLMLAVLTQPFDRYVSDGMAARSYTEANGHNIVNVILVDFRAIDTMGEITVLTMAALGVYVLMRMPATLRPAFQARDGADDLPGDGAPGAPDAADVPPEPQPAQEPAA